MKQWKQKVVAVLLVLSMILGFAPMELKAFAAEDNVLSVSEMSKEKLTNSKVVGMFTINATSEKTVEIDANEKTAEDGESFTQRLKLGGAGEAGFRSISFSIAQKSTVTVYAMSSTSSEDRELALFSADGTMVDSMVAYGTSLAKGTFSIEEAGDYYLASTKSGVNVYQVLVDTSSLKALNVSELETQKLTSSTMFGDFTITASSEKAVEIDANEKTADDGESFTKRMKLGGTGSADFRSIQFSTAGKATISVYAMSSSSSADRVLGLYDMEGNLLSQVDALGASLVKGTLQVPSAGDYYLASLSSGVNVYCIKVESGAGQIVRLPWDQIGRAKLESVEVSSSDPSKLVVKFNAVTGNDGADTATAILYNEQNEIVATASVGKSSNNEKTVELVPPASGSYTVRVKTERSNEETARYSKIVSADFTLPLGQTVVRAVNRGNGDVLVKWNEVKEAKSYIVEIKETTADKYVTALTVSETQGLVKGLKVDSDYDIRVVAVRDEDKVASDAIHKKVKAAEEREWAYTFFGQSIKENVNTMEMIEEENLTFKLNSCTVKEDGTIDAKGGKFTTFHDGISYYYTEVNPKTENFVLTGTFQLDYINTTPDGQEGFGIVAMDSLGEYGVSSVNHYTNSASIIATKFEATIDGTKYTCKDTIGARFVSGITKEVLASGDSAIATSAKNVSKAFSYDKKDLVKAGEKYTLTLVKDNTGFRAYVNNDKSNEFIMYDANKLLELDSDKIYVGFAAARGCNVTVSDVSLTITNPATDPKAEKEPAELIALSTKVDAPTTSANSNYNLVFRANADGVITIKDSKNTIVNGAKVRANEDYSKVVTLKKDDNSFVITFDPVDSYIPGKNQVLASYAPVTVEHKVSYKTYEGDVIYVSADGKATGAGTKASPLDIHTATAYVKAGQTIELAGGVYEMTKALTIARGIDGTYGNRITLKSAKGERAILNFSKANGGMQVWGNYWYIENIDVTETPGNVKGLQVAGDYNVISLVNTYKNGDTGLQISGTGSETYEKWPKYNLILNCTSYDNRDPGMNNADGFAAKLTCAEGNVFRGCIAYNNLDDGWDLFSKIESGPIGAVKIENCIAYKNGTLSNGTGNGDGNGFKLGGDGISVAHELINCVSYANNTAGITSNSDPAVIVKNCTSYGNKGANITLYGKGSDARQFVASNNISMAGAGDNISEMPSLATSDNYFNLQGKCVNSEGTELTKDIFVSVDTTIAPTRTANGSIEMNGLLVLKEADALAYGAVITITEFEEIAPGVMEYIVKAGDCLSRIAKNIYGKESAWKDIYEWNKDIISNPNLILIGQILKLFQ